MYYKLMIKIGGGIQSHSDQEPAPDGSAFQGSPFELSPLSRVVLHQNDDSRNSREESSNWTASRPESEPDQASTTASDFATASSSSGQHSTDALIQAPGTRLPGAAVRRVNTINLPSPHTVDGRPNLRRAHLLEFARSPAPPNRTHGDKSPNAHGQVSEESTQPRPFEFY